MIGFRALSVVAALGALVAASSAHAANCPGNPDAIGTSRTLYIDPTEHVRLGMMQYRESLPLADHEVVLTFDDGPLPPHTTQVLKTLASECVKATFFLIGRMAKTFPDTVRQIHAAGHTIGTHSQNHPLRFNRMTTAQINQEVEGGIASVAAALGDRSEISPFFRIPGLLRSPTVERYLTDKTLMTWSADFPADDWLRISDKEIAARALKRIEARRGGMLLLHDIKPTTARALLTILHELKKRGYRIVHVEPASAEHPKTVTRIADWAAYRHWAAWPKSPQVIRLAHAKPVLPAPDPRRFQLANGLLLSPLRPPPAQSAAYASAAKEMAAPWPPASTLPTELAAVNTPTLAVPGRATFGIGKGAVPIALKATAKAPKRQPRHKALAHRATWHARPTPHFRVAHD